MRKLKRFERAKSADELEVGDVILNIPYNVDEGDAHYSARPITDLSLVDDLIQATTADGFIRKYAVNEQVTVYYK